MPADSAVVRSGLGPLETPFVTVSGNDLGTTPIKPALQDIAASSGGRARVFKAAIHNPNASAYLAINFVTRGDAAPSAAALTATIAASPSTATGMLIPPGGTRDISYESSFELVIVASAAASSYNIASTLFG